MVDEDTSTVDAELTTTSAVLDKIAPAAVTITEPPLKTSRADALLSEISSDETSTVPAETATTSLATRTESPPLTSKLLPADTDTLVELTDSDSPDTASSTLDDATRTDPLPTVRPKWKNVLSQSANKPPPIDDKLTDTTLCRANVTCKPSIEYEPAPTEDLHTSTRDDDGDPSDRVAVAPPADSKRAAPTKEPRTTTSTTSDISGTELVKAENELDERHT